MIIAYLISNLQFNIRNISYITSLCLLPFFYHQGGSANENAEMSPEKLVEKQRIVIEEMKYVVLT